MRVKVKVGLQTGIVICHHFVLEGVVWIAVGIGVGFEVGVGGWVRVW